ncbi:MAG: hypothetical protein O2999_08705 [Nitrospirae bacterium]|nr:hypothetical protein [Nitrospirota bacterium]MDA1304363.1 hypothetical protein [Nitrospirota bacterium]
MKCSRCQGLVVEDQLYDPDGPYLHIAILRCLNCGETTYIKDDKGKGQIQPQPNRTVSKAA